jgi:hypothetical protein
VGEKDFEGLDSTYEVFQRRSRIWVFVVPLAMLLVVIAVVSALVFAGVLEGHRLGATPSEAPTTGSTVIIFP